MSQVQAPQLTSVRASGGFEIIIAADTQNFDLRAAIDALGYDGLSATTVMCVVNAGVIINSADAALAGFDTGIWPGGVVIDITNYGTIRGAGGRGGQGAGQTAPHPDRDGVGGGTALNIQTPTTINNIGVLTGGGGGGGGGGNNVGGNVAGGGGGGGAGDVFGLGNGGGGGTATAGANGTLTTGGAGGVGYNGGGDGGQAAGPGLAGADGVGVGWLITGGYGGGAGKAVNGNINATWIAIGTRTGLIV